MRVRLTLAAERDIQRIGDWIAIDSEREADRFLERMLEACTSIGPFPLAYPMEASVADLRLRKRAFESYLIFYRVTDAVEVIRIIHGAREYEAILRETEG